jgi:hypothetical protein
MTVMRIARAHCLFGVLECLAMSACSPSSWFTAPPDYVLLDSSRPPHLIPATAPATYTWSITSLDGRTIPMARFKGRVLFLHFFATWDYAGYDIPSVQRLSDLLSSRGIVVLCISREKPRFLERFRRQGNYSLPFYIESKSRPPIFDASSPIATFIISKEGTVVAKHQGWARWDTKAPLQLLQRLLVDKSSTS